MEAPRSVRFRPRTPKVGDHAADMPLGDGDVLVLVRTEYGLGERLRPQIPGVDERLRVRRFQVEVQPEEAAAEDVEIGERLLG